MAGHAKGQQKAQTALTDRCLTKKELAKQLNISRQTVRKFFPGLPVDLLFFVKICKDLQLEWDQIAVKPTLKTIKEKKQPNFAQGIEELVREVQKLYDHKIKHQCNKYFHNQYTISTCLATRKYRCSLPMTQTDRATLQRDSKVVLKSIEAQHKLLVEKVREIYSFSHPTFQEYFASLAVVNSFETEDVKKSVSRMSRNWREVFVLTAAMMQPADEFLLSMKRKIDDILKPDDKLQQLLIWVRKYSCSPQLIYKPVNLSACQPIVLRAFHLELALDFELNINKTREHNSISKVFALTSSVALNFASTRDLNRAFARVISYAESSNPSVYFEMDIFIHLIRDRSVEIKASFQKLKDQLPDPDLNELIFQQWWSAKGQDWTQQLRAVMIQYWNIGHDWQFNEHQKELLKQYYNANKLLVDCLNSGCQVSPEVRQEIEDTLLLPIVELEKG